MLKILRPAVTAAFLFSTLFVANIVQMASLILLPFSRRAFRSVNRFCADAWWGLCVSWTEGLCGIRPVFTGDALPHGENAIVVANHQQMPDILTLMCLAKRKGRLGDMKWFVKDPIKYVPGVGWGMLFLDCLFVKRAWDSDKAMIERTFAKFLRESIPIWLISFSEGTRITPAKLARSNRIAHKLGCPETKHVMLPRTRGFVAAMQGLGDYIDAVYDVTIAYPDGIPTLWTFFARGRRTGFHMHVRRHAAGSLPRESEAVSRWLLERFVEKDRLLANFEKNGVLG